ncbi:MAG: GNAT family N-acetyltransferase [Candidatus Latescibacteria bacterium]|nr:GNAT family N-acetyltransferase [Candidatus Latescibacterota bacterium]
MTEADDEVVCEITAQCLRFAADVCDFTQEQVALALKKYCSRQHVASLRVKGISFIAELDGAVVGVVTTKDNSIQALFVNPVVHRKGIGRALFHQAQKEIDKAGYPALRVVTAASAVPFYSAMGMTPTASLRPKDGPFCGANLVVLEKPIKPQPNIQADIKEGTT